MGQIVDISERGIQLAVSTERLSIVHSNKQKNYVALQEVDAVLVSEKAVNFTGAVLSELATWRIPMVICDGKYLPAGVLCPIFREGSEHIVAFHHQLTMKKSLKKQIWKQLVLEKIRGQHATLKRNGYASNLLKLAKIIRSGDPDNVEARAAAQYWKTLDVFPNRDYSATNANMLFNYVYAVVYAMVASCGSPLK